VTPPVTAQWQDLPIGGGGFGAYLDVNQSDGTRLFLPDTYGCYKWSGTTNINIVNNASFTAKHSGFFPKTGTKQVLRFPLGYEQIFAAASAPSNSQIIYLAKYGGVFISTDGGANFTSPGYLETGTVGPSAPVGSNVVNLASAVPSWMTTILALNYPFYTWDVTDVGALTGSMTIKNGASQIFFYGPVVASPGVSAGATLGYGIVMLVGGGLGRVSGPKMAIDPVNPSICYLSTQFNGCKVTTNQGATWSAPPSIPVSNTQPSGDANEPCYTICFDNSGGTAGGATKNIYVWAYGASTPALYLSTDAGASFNQVTTTGAPPANSGTSNHFCPSMAVGQDGTVWFVDAQISHASIGAASLWRYTPGGVGGLSGTWRQQNLSGALPWGVAVKPGTLGSGNYNTVAVLIFGSGGLCTTTNATDPTPKWNVLNSSYSTSSPAGSPPWLSWIRVDLNGGNPLGGLIFFDPNTGHLLAGFGQGIWETPFITVGNPAWTCWSQGTENQVSRVGMKPSGQQLVLGFEDNGIIAIPTLGTQPSVTNNPVYDNVLQACYSLDYAASATNKQVCIQGGNNSAAPAGNGYSTDGGTTWTPFNTGWNVTVPGANLSNNGGLVKVDLTGTGQTTSGLSVYGNGSGTILRVSDLNNPPARNGTPITGSSSIIYASVSAVDAVHNTFTLAGTNPAAIQSAGSYKFWIESLFTDHGGTLGNVITGIANDGGEVRLTLASFYCGTLNSSGIINVSGVVGSGINGSWFIHHIGSNTITLVGSHFATASYTSGGSITSFPLTLGCIALDQAGSSIVLIPTNGNGSAACTDLPYYSSNFGQSWSKLGVPATGQAWPLTQGITSSTLVSGTLTVNTNIAHGLLAGQPIQLAGTGTSADNGPVKIFSVSSTQIVIHSITLTSTLKNGHIVNGWPAAGTGGAQPLCADRVSADTFYLSNYLYGLFKSTSGGTTTMLSTDGSKANQILKSVPGKAGELFGMSPTPNGNYDVYPTTTNTLNYWNGRAWSSITAAVCPICFDIGPQRPGTVIYPTIWCAKWSSATGSYGVHYSTDKGVTWSQIGGQDYPNNSSDFPICIVCDQDKWNQVFVGFLNSSFAWYNGDGT
jgi:hypothetical protein